MLILISPAKKQNFDTQAPTDLTTSLVFPSEITKLVKTVKQYSPAELGKLMSTSTKLSELNYQRYQGFHFSDNNEKQSLWAFQGDVYKSLDAASFNQQDIQFAQENLVMLSGLYGLLRPCDLMKPYRLEMKTALQNNQGKDLYQFWGAKLTDTLNQWLEPRSKKTIINLASSEYFKAIQPKNINGNVITIDFKENKDGQFKTIGIFAKRARGLMARYIIKHQITNPDNLKNFGENGYQFDATLSNENKMVFCR